MAGSFGYVWRDRTQTTTQKIIQARMIAQGATILLILGAGWLYSTATPVRPPFVLPLAAVTEFSGCPG